MRLLGKLPSLTALPFLSSLPYSFDAEKECLSVLGLSVVIGVTKHLVRSKLKGGRVSFVSHLESPIHLCRDVIEGEHG